MDEIGGRSCYLPETSEGPRRRWHSLLQSPGSEVPLCHVLSLSTSYSRLEAIIKEFLSQTDLEPERATFGVAGPVVEGQAAVTNLSWVISEAHVKKEFGFADVRLLNDLEAIAEAIPILEPEDLATLRAGDRIEGGTIAVIAPGTGLGEAFLTWDGRQYISHASEGGHTNFGPRNEREIDLLRFLLDRYETVSYERVCSGSGFPNIYAFLRDRGHGSEPSWLTRQLAEASDLTPIIVNAALNAEPGCELCEAALHMFVSILGSEAGNLALKVLATGGLYIGGGIPPRILPVLRAGTFLDAFLSKGPSVDGPGQDAGPRHSQPVGRAVGSCQLRLRDAIRVVDARCT